MVAAQRDQLAGDHDRAGGRDPASDGDRLDAGTWWGSGGSGAAQVASLVVGQRVRPGSQQLTGLRVEDQQDVVLDADGDPAAAEDLRGQVPAPTEADQALGGDGAVDLDRGPVGLDRWQRGRAGGAASGRGEGGELVVLQAVHRSGKLLLEQAQAGGNARIGWFVGQRVSCR